MMDRENIEKYLTAYLGDKIRPEQAREIAFYISSGLPERPRRRRFGFYFGVER